MKVTLEIEVNEQIYGSGENSQHWWSVHAPDLARQMEEVEFSSEDSDFFDAFVEQFSGMNNNVFAGPSLGYALRVMGDEMHGDGREEKIYEGGLQSRLPIHEQDPLFREKPKLVKAEYVDTSEQAVKMEMEDRFPDHFWMVDGSDWRAERRIYATHPLLEEFEPLNRPARELVQMAAEDVKQDYDWSEERMENFMELVNRYV